VFLAVTVRRADSHTLRSIVHALTYLVNSTVSLPLSDCQLFWGVTFSISCTVHTGMMKNMKWMGDKGVNTKVYVFDIKDPSKNRQPLAVFEAPPMFAYHHINAYEDPRAKGTGTGDVDIVVDFSGYDTLDIANGDHCFALIHNIEDPELRKLQCRDARQYRLRLPLPPKQAPGVTLRASLPFIRPSILVAKDKEGRELTFELPRMDPRKKMMKHRY
jgi:Retinal pigment epithelial membrane protein